MLDFNRISPGLVISAFLDERHRRESIPSLSEEQFTQPHGTAPPSGMWESLIGLMRGVPAMAVNVLYLRRYGYCGHQVERGFILPDGCKTVEEWEASDPEERAKIIPSDRRVANDPPYSAVAARLGINEHEARALVRDAHGTVAENLAALKARTLPADRARLESEERALQEERLRRAIADRLPRRMRRTS